jgi:hypothetical protein
MIAMATTEASLTAPPFVPIPPPFAVAWVGVIGGPDTVYVPFWVGNIVTVPIPLEPWYVPVPAGPVVASSVQGGSELVSGEGSVHVVCTVLRVPVSYPTVIVVAFLMVNPGDDPETVTVDRVYLFVTVDTVVVWLAVVVMVVETPSTAVEPWSVTVTMIIIVVEGEHIPLSLDDSGPTVFEETPEVGDSPELAECVPVLLSMVVSVVALIT